MKGTTVGKMSEARRGGSPWFWAAVLGGAVLLTGACASTPSRPGDVCAIFQEKPAWYRGALRAEKRWNIPIPVMMAFAYKESSFVHNARPARTKLLFVIPWKRPSSAYGFAQATNETWSDYRRATGRRGADRNEFGDAIDFVGWYLDRAHRHLGIPRNDARGLYLSYHEGLSGYRSGRWKSNAWLKGAADKVAANASRYGRQLAACRNSLKRKRFLFF